MIRCEILSDRICFSNEAHNTVLCLSFSCTSSMCEKQKYCIKELADSIPKDRIADLAEMILNNSEHQGEKGYRRNDILRDILNEANKEV